MPPQEAGFRSIGDIASRVSNQPGDLILADSRGDKTPIELFIAGVQGWETALRRVIAGASEDAKSL
jgi:hypothetical protein